MVGGSLPPRAKKGQVWFALTPDLDVYPHCLSCPPLAGLVFCNSKDEPKWESGLGDKRGARLLYGGDWMPTPLEFAEAKAMVEEAAPESEEEEENEEAEETEAEQDEKSKKKNELPPGIRIRSGNLPELDHHVLQIVGKDSDAGDEDLSGAACKFYVKAGKKVLALMDDLPVLCEFTKPGAAGAGDELDARVLALNRGANGERHRRFVDSVKDLTETDWGGWPLLGPRTCAWCLGFIAEQDTHPRSRHTKWKADCGLTSADRGVAEHELCMRLLDLGVTYDQLNITELVTFELICRRAQMAEMRHRDRMLGDSDDDDFLFLGVGETRGLIMVAPSLEAHLATELSKESAVLKEKRKMREERQLARGPGHSGRLSRNQEKAQRRQETKGKGKGSPPGGVNPE